MADGARGQRPAATTTELPGLQVSGAIVIARKPAVAAVPDGRPEGAPATPVRLLDTSFRGPLLAGLAGVVIAVVFAAAYTVTAIGEAQVENLMVRNSAQLSQSVYEAETQCRSFLATGNQAALKGFRDASNRIDRSVAAFLAAARAAPLVGALLVSSIQESAQRINAWRELYAKRAVNFRADGSGRKLAELNKRGIESWLVGDMHEALAATGRNLATAISQSGSRSKLPRLLTLGVSLAGLGLLLGAGAVFARRGIVLVGRARERGESLASLIDWAERIQFVASTEEAVRMLSSALCEQKGVATATVLMRTEEGDEIGVVGREASGAEGGQRGRVRDVEGCPVMRTGQRCVVTGAGKRAVCSCPFAGEESGSWACLPLLAQGRTVGLVRLEADHRRAFGPDYLDQAETFVRLTSLTLGSLITLARAEEQATTDALTGVFNRRFLDAFLDKEVQMARRHEESLSVLMVDLDHFKDFNDRYGHQAGDLVLREFGHVVTSIVRDGDLVARYGGEEFTIVLPRAGRDAALTTAERVRGAVESMRLPGLAGLEPPVITVSIGVATVPGAGDGAADLLRVADRGLYRAKQSGRNRVEPFDPAQPSIPSQERPKTRVRSVEPPAT